MNDNRALKIQSCASFVTSRSVGNGLQTLSENLCVCRQTHESKRGAVGTHFCHVDIAI